MKINPNSYVSIIGQWKDPRTDKWCEVERFVPWKLIWDMEKIKDPDDNKVVYWVRIYRPNPQDKPVSYKLTSKKYNEIKNGLKNVNFSAAIIQTSEQIRETVEKEVSEAVEIKMKEFATISSLEIP